MLFKHVDYVYWKAKKKATKEREELTEENKERKIEEALLIYLAIENNDEDKVDKAVSEILDVSGKIKAERIVLFPFVHLFIDTPASPSVSMRILDEISKKLGMEVYRIPFGW
ncbi:MAG: threonine--tRNA ligase, partial [Methanomicrobia archaeon]|nr:threonine--tRNA ligase [Methanomicrobia archaeon]